MSKKILILDSNRRTVQGLERMILGINPNIQVYTPEGYDDALKIALDVQIDVFVLDIFITNLIPSDTSGLKFAESIRKFENYLFTPIIFISGVMDPKFYAFQHLHSFAYIEKPASLDQVQKVIKQALLYTAPKAEDKILYFRKNGILLAVNLSSILFVQTINHVLYVHMAGEDLEIPYYTIKQFLKEADSAGFIQCNRNTVINSRFIKNIDLPNKYIHLKDCTVPIEIGASFTKNIVEVLLHE